MSILKHCKAGHPLHSTTSRVIVHKTGQTEHRCLRCQAIRQAEYRKKESVKRAAKGNHLWRASDIRTAQKGYEQ